MDFRAMDPFGAALIDYLGGERAAVAVMHRDDGLKQDLPISLFFRSPAEFSPLEQTALALCRGRVLDVGAGGGIHSMELLNRGLCVSAIDICQHAVDVLRRKGLKEVHCADISGFAGGPFDTLLMLGHGIGMVETMDGLDHFLADVHRLLGDDGQILINSMDARRTTDPVHLAYHDLNRRNGRYFGETRLRLEYKKLVGAPYGWLLLDSESLADHSRAAGLDCNVVLSDNNGEYLAQLTRH